MTEPPHTDQHAQSGALRTERPSFNPDSLEVAPGTIHEIVQGWVPEMATEEEIRVALEKAFDYRGDVTLTLKDGSKIEGYIFDRVSGKNVRESFVRVIPNNSNERKKIAYADIAALAFSGRDTAAGKSWEAWVRKYWEKKTSGQGNISLQPEALD